MTGDKGLQFMSTANADVQKADVRFLRRILFTLVAVTVITMGFGMATTVLTVNAQGPAGGYDVTR